jgi:LPPG:FO 2-phospho-L-lactate transferase
LPADALTAVVNTGDDFTHWNLHVSPDLDTVMYTLAGLSHEERGWGLAEESFGALEMMRRYGAESWFQIGDRDLVTHLLRSQALSQGETLSDVTRRLCRALGVEQRILPMSDGACKTMIETRDEGTLPFQDWFVRRRCEPAVLRVGWEGGPGPAPGVLEALAAAELVLIGPSNPYVSIDPIITRPGVREAMTRVPVLAVSPIVAGQAVKGPLARMIREIADVTPSALAIARHYADLLDAMVVEHGDEAALRDQRLAVFATSTVMRSRSDSAELARQTLSFAESLCS